jgi:hypothetical protein
MLLQGVTADQVDSIWATLEPLFQRSIDRGTPVAEETTEDILKQIKSGELSMWITYEPSEDGPATLKAVATAYIADLPKVRRAVIKHLAGIEMESWLEFYPILEEWAKGYGAQQIVIKGRAGWSRIMNQYGFEPQYVALAKTI